MDKLVLASPYCTIDDKKTHGMGHMDMIKYDEIVANMPVTFQQLSPKIPDMAMSEAIYEQQANTSSMVLQYAKTILQTSLADYDYYMNEKPNGDLEHDNEMFMKKRNYVENLVPMQLDDVMFYIEALIHRCHWDQSDFGQDKQIYDSGKKASGVDKIPKLTQLRMCLMWSIPQDEYVKEPETYEPSIASSLRTEML